MTRGSGRRGIVAAAAVLALIACAAGLSASPAPFDFSRSAGLFDAGERDSAWLEIADSTLTPGDSLTLLTNPESSEMDRPPPRLTDAVIASRASRASWRTMESSPGASVYLLHVAAFDSIESTLGIGLLAPRRAFRIEEDHVTSDLDGDGTPERYTECASFEGIHFEIWEGVPFQGESVTDLYYYVPYSLDPTCPGLDSLGGDPPPGD
jgi:hypothetical protein